MTDSFGNGNSEELRGRILRAARKVWGIDTLRPLQMEAVEAALGGRDCLVVLPTGGGKSLCYQLPPLLERSVGVVVSPLISLMKDQVDSLRLAGYPAAAIHSALTVVERRDVLREARSGRLRLLFVSPERVQTDQFRELVSELRVRSFAVDEAHCISHWGHDFRQDYRRLGNLREMFPDASIQAFTATATPRVRDDICEQLRLRTPTVLVGVFDRPNLTYRVLPKQQSYQRIRSLIRKHRDGAVIVYCLSRRETEQLAARLVADEIRAEAYHAGLDPERRSRVQEGFARERMDVIVATVAFGMGIDRSDVRCVIHSSLPRSIEQYQQETGRAGRDGLESECVLYYSYADVIRWNSLLEKSFAEYPELLRAQCALLAEVQAFCKSTQCRHRALSRYFGQEYGPPTCGACDVCLGEVDVLPESTVIAQKVLSGVYRLGGNFGVGYLIDMLRGGDTERIRRFGHDRLSTYGILKEYSQDALRDLVHQLLDQGLLDRSEGDRPVISLNPESTRILRGERQVRLKRPASVPVSKLPMDTPGSASLFQELRRARRRWADERGVPPYVVFSDATLKELARVRPKDRDELLEVKGIGQRKLRDYGDRLLQVIRTWESSSAARTE